MAVLQAYAFFVRVTMTHVHVNSVRTADMGCSADVSRSRGIKMNGSRSVLIEHSRSLRTVQKKKPGNHRKRTDREKQKLSSYRVQTKNH